MGNSAYRVRQQQKTDTSNNWTIAGNNGFVPLKGEFIVYLDLNQFKIGDGETNINNLPFITTNSGGGEGGGGNVENAVLYVHQDLNIEQKAQARENIGAIGEDEVPTVEEMVQAVIERLSLAEEGKF